MDSIHKVKWNILPHPPYSPDLASSGYNLFGSIKDDLVRKRFWNNEEMILDVEEWLHWLP